MIKRVCRCPKKESLEGMRTDAVWASKACALRWSRENPGKELPGRGNAHIIDTRGRSGRQVSARKMERVLTHKYGWPHSVAHEAVNEALPEAQRSKEAA